MEQWAALAQETRDMLVAGKKREIAPLLNANFDLRRKIYGDKMAPGPGPKGRSRKLESFSA